MDLPGWIVTSHHPEIMTYVGPNDVDRNKRSEVAIGLLGRSKRDQDAHELEIVHIEDRRDTT
jgi:hypothetical protein